MNCPICSECHDVAACPALQHCFVCDQIACSCGFSQDKQARLFAKRKLMQKLDDLSASFAAACFRCGGNHLSMMCPSAIERQEIPSNEGKVCVNCGSRRHQSAACTFEIQNQLEFGIWVNARDAESRK